MMKKIVTQMQLKRHQNSKICENKQQNVGVVLPLQDYKCKYCEDAFY
jgi:hypothetical protein